MFVPGTLFDLIMLPFTPPFLFHVHASSSNVLEHYNVSVTTHDQQILYGYNMLYKCTYSNTGLKESKAYNVPTPLYEGIL